ncbi:MAG: tetraacyldisaccharide 4'-kinase [Bacteroidota bacterium]
MNSIIKNLARLLLLPLSLLYGIGVSSRHFLYGSGLLKSTEFSIPLISVGNLSVGGAGKTPHVEYLIRLLKDYINVGTLSRGYKRKTKGFLFVHGHQNASEVGDEPLQYKRKFPDVLVAVGENRTLAIPEMMRYFPDTQLVILDDAFQHIAIKPSLNILLTEYEHPFTTDFLLPSGRLREWRSAYQRADLIVVTKCPPLLAQERKERMIERIQPLPHQKIFFSHYTYGHPYYIFNRRYRGKLSKEVDVLLICAIARTDYLLDYLEEQVNSIVLMSFEDHHYFTKHDIGSLNATFQRMKSERKVIITTEKDAMRLELHKAFLTEHQLPIFVLPAQVDFLFEEGEQFDEAIRNHLLSFRV